MATRGGYQQNGFRRQVGSPKAKGRENKDTLCRNITIYGHCRYENSGCTFNHDQAKNSSSNTDMSKKSLNVDSPSFTPSNPQQPTKKATFSTQALSAPAFTPRGSGAATPTGVASSVKQDAATFNASAAAVAEFTPQTFGLGSSSAGVSGGPPSEPMSYDNFSMASVGQALPGSAPYNPYSEEHNAALGAANNAFFQAQNPYNSTTQPLLHHLYFPTGPHKEDLLPYQRMPHDFFMSEKLRQELTKRLEASQQVISSGLLPTLDNFHSLVALDTSNRKNANTFGYPTWVYKAFETKTGRARCLRRLEGFRLTSEQAIRCVKDWKRVDCASVVPILDAFTTRAFGDSSLLFVQEYFPLSKTLLETHFPSPSNMHGARLKVQSPINERVLWTYITQIGNGLKAIHSANLAARCLDLGKIIVTDKNRIRLNACAILDVVHYEARRPVAELQQEDLHLFGRAILSLATLTPPTLMANMNTALDHLARHYSAELRETIIWLLTPQQPGQQKNIDEFIRGTYSHFVTALNESFNNSDYLTSEFSTAIENGRVARLMMKLAAINERPDLNGDTKWAENGERYTLKLFRDYVFHQVDSNGKPVIDIGHMITCLNKLDAGVDEQICLTSRDNETIFIVTYKTLREQLRTSFAELTRGSKGRGGL